MIRKTHPDCKCELRNILINGNKRGCSGFVYNPTTDVTVYINTEPSVCGGDVMCRYARDNKDYTGACNHNFSNNNVPSLVEDTCKMLDDHDRYEHEMSSVGKGIRNNCR